MYEDIASYIKSVVNLTGEEYSSFQTNKNMNENEDEANYNYHSDDFTYNYEILNDISSAVRIE